MREIQNYGINTISRSFVEDIKQLYCDRLQLTIDNESRVFHGSLVAFLADTLTSS